MGASANAHPGAPAEPVKAPRGFTREQILEATARQLEAEGFRVMALGGWGGREEPVPVNGQVPDLKAKWSDEVVLVVVETPETLHDEASEARWKAFGRSYFTFEVALPGAILGEARLLARARGVRVNRFWVY